MLELPNFSPLAIALASSAAVLLIGWSAAAVVRWYRFRRRRHLPAQAGASALALCSTLAGQRRAALGALACAICSALTALFATQPADFSNWRTVDSLSALGLIGLAALSLTIIVRRLPREQKAGNDVLVRHRTAVRLESIGLPRQRLFHDVVPSSGGNIPHVLTATSGVYAIYSIPDRFGASGAMLRDRNLLVLPIARATVDLKTIRSRTAQLQHWIEAETGHTSRVKTVLVLNGWAPQSQGPGDILVVAPPDVVMLKGWRDASAALMDEQLTDIQKLLEKAHAPHFRSWSGYRAHALARTRKRYVKSSGSATAANA